MNSRFHIGNKYEYCPNGNYWVEISGIFDREVYLFCDCNGCGGQVYVLRVRKANIPTDRLKEILDDQRQYKKKAKAKELINDANVDKVLELLGGTDDTTSR